MHILCARLCSKCVHYLIITIFRHFFLLILYVRKIRHRAMEQPFQSIQLEELVLCYLVLETTHLTATHTLFSHLNVTRVMTCQHFSSFIHKTGLLSSYCARLAMISFILQSFAMQANPLKYIWRHWYIL